MGRHEEAIAEKKRAVELDPLSLVMNRSLGWTFYFARHYDAAIEQYRKTLELDPNFALAQLTARGSLQAKGDASRSDSRSPQGINAFWGKTTRN